jgi:TatD DNase family protein
MNGFDSHCHLDFIDNASDLMADARKAGVSQWLVPGTEPEQWQQAHQMFCEDPRVKLGVGHHPWFLPESQPDTDQLNTWLDNHVDCIALGEIGLDFYRHNPRSSAADHQRDWFLAQLAVATERQLPVIIHSVKAHDRILQGLKHAKEVTGVVHGFVGPYEQAMAYIDRGLYLGAGSVVFRSAKTLDAFARIPADRLLIETDAPDQRIPDNQRANALLDWLRILERIADARRIGARDLADRVLSNANALFGRPDSSQ